MFPALISRWDAWSITELLVEKWSLMAKDVFVSNCSPEKAKVSPKWVTKRSQPNLFLKLRELL